MSALAPQQLQLVARTRATPLMTSSPAIGNYADRLTSADLEHGTLDGFHAGCRAELACPARRRAGMSCLTVGIRYAGDWPFRRLVDEGVPPVEAAARIAAADREARRPNRRATRPARALAAVPRGDRPGTGVTAVSQPRAPRGVPHGKRQGYDGYGCRRPEDCPNYGTDLPTCGEVGRAYARARYHATKRRAA